MVPNTFEYPVTVFRQQRQSPIQVAFVAPASHVLCWSGIPRKSDELLTGYQRFRDTERIDREIVPFFQNPENCSPTALVIALRKDSGLGSTELIIEGADINHILPGTAYRGILRITVNEEALKTEEVFSAALSYVSDRLKDEDQGSEESEDEDEEGEDEDDGDDEETETEEGESNSDSNALMTEVEDDGTLTADFHLGTTTLKKMRVLLEDRENWKNEKFRDAIADYVKPAFVIDGQHRATAGAKFENGILFLICGLYDASWSEQVFQFTVVNLKPKRIPPALITSIAALSLSRGEQEQVSERLQAAGVKMIEVDVMSLVAYDETSPFCDMVAMAVGDRKTEADRLGYGAMKRIAMEWYTAKRTSTTLMAKQLYATNSARNARIKWRNDRVWFHFFKRFWHTVRDHYPIHLWAKTPESRLFVGAHLWALQEVVLNVADGQMASSWKLPDTLMKFDERLALLDEKFLEVVSTSLGYIPAEVWMTEWAKSSQDTTAGRKELVDLFTRFVDEGKKKGKWRNWEKHPWFDKDAAAKDAAKNKGRAKPTDKA